VSLFVELNLVHFLVQFLWSSFNILQCLFLRGNRVHCTLWDDFAFKMQQFLDTHDPSLPVVIIFQLCKLKKYLG
jgi:hypothetical protein